MNKHALIVLSALLPLMGCPSDDVPGSGESGDSGDGSSTGSSMTSPATVTMTGADSSSSADSTAGSSGATGDPDSSTGSTPMCGDGVVDEGEDCDDAGESEACNVDCSASMCGDGVTNESAGEACDDAGNSLLCDADCTPSMCGDGTVNPIALEDCEDGNDDDFDFCSNTCMVAPVVVLDSVHTLNTDTGELDGMVLQHFDVATGTWYSTGFEVQEGATLRVVGSQALTLEVDGTVVITGTVDVSGGNGGNPTTNISACDTAGAGGVAGPGGFDGGVGAGNGGTGTEDGGPGEGPGMAPAGGGISSTHTAGLYGGAGAAAVAT